MIVAAVIPLGATILRLEQLQPSNCYKDHKTNKCKIIQSYHFQYTFTLDMNRIAMELRWPQFSHLLDNILSIELCLISNRISISLLRMVRTFPSIIQVYSKFIYALGMDVSQGRRCGLFPFKADGESPKAILGEANSEEVQWMLYMSLISISVRENSCSIWYDG